MNIIRGVINQTNQYFNECENPIHKIIVSNIIKRNIAFQEYNLKNKKLNKKKEIYDINKLHKKTAIRGIEFKDIKDENDNDNDNEHTEEEQPKEKKKKKKTKNVAKVNVAKVSGAKVNGYLELLKYNQNRNKQK